MNKPQKLEKIQLMLQNIMKSADMEVERDSHGIPIIEDVFSLIDSDLFILLSKIEKRLKEQGF